MSFQPIRRILPASIRDSGIEVQISAIRVLEEASAALTRMWGAEQASYVEMVSFKEGVLNISVRSPSAAHALRASETQWINEINRALGSRKVAKISMRRAGF
jgi:hypothetical protein